MYYKIVNQDCKVFKELKALREKENAIDEKNSELIKEMAGQNFNNYLGYAPQEGFCRTRRYIGLEFESPEKLDPKQWKQHKEYPSIYVPNRKFKVGREADKFLNDLESSYYTAVYDIMGLNALRRFKTPYVEMVDDTIICYLDDNHTPADQENVIEITSKEFNEIRDRLLSEV